ncbi:hypothetical protein RND81_02G161200 [Saponaria officinalis]|uniref:RING-type domain-containing protein n=1 Tax=Saponaria officinalis TaxID=3572 RepID=A0AAW1MV19_SAPOF
MSILPHTNQGSKSSSSSSSNFQNPNFNHGNFTINDEQQQSEQRNHRFSLSSPNTASLQISEGQSSSSMLDSVSVAETAADSSGSSKKLIKCPWLVAKLTFVTGYRNSNGWKKSSNQILNDRVQSCSVAQGGVGSPESGGEFSNSPPNGRGSGSARKKSQILNGNHLLNFQYNPIARPQLRSPPPRKPQKIKPYNKDLFIQANYRFVVLNSGNYSIESMDPDKTLLWEDIICVKYSTPHPVQCPICLDDPICPQITSCGHIFCFPCILQYLLMGEDNHKAECWRKCPLCFMMISSKDMYTIYIENVGEHNVGDTIDFMLLTRKKDSFSLHEQCKGESGKTRDSFSKFILTLDVDLSVREAMSALDSWLVRADSGLVDDLEKLPYVCAAMEHLEQRKQYWNARRISAGNISCKTVNCKGVSDEYPKFEDGILSPFDDTTKMIENLTVDVRGGSSFVQSSDTDESQEGQGTLPSLCDQSKIMQSQVDRDPKDRDAYNFYQAVNGQPIILHPLNMKCLLHHYGSYDQLPSRVSGKILQLESVTQSEAMRRRYRYLSHFPLTTTFQLCEIDIREILPLEAPSPFMDEIKKREKQRKWLAKKEHEDRSKAEAVAAYSLPIPYNMVQSSFDGPSAFSMDDFEVLGNSTTTVASSPPVQGGRQLFANVARLGFAAGGDSPSLCRQETTSRPPTETSSNAGTTQALRSFANVIAREASTETSDARKTIEAGKKGKKQNRVLLSTAGGRRY